MPWTRSPTASCKIRNWKWEDGTNKLFVKRQGWVVTREAADTLGLLNGSLLDFLCHTVTLQPCFLIFVPRNATLVSSITNTTSIRSATRSNCWWYHSQLLPCWEARRNVPNTDKRLQVGVRAFSSAPNHLLELWPPSHLQLLVGFAAGQQVSGGDAHTPDTILHNPVWESLHYCVPLNRAPVPTVLYCNNKHEWLHMTIGDCDALQWMWISF